MLAFEAYLAETAAEQDAYFTRLLPKADGSRARLIEAMHYGLQGGKRVRGLLVLESAALFAVSRSSALQVAAAAEMVHAYSLIHDDLPVMDNSSLRRGRAATHVAFDEVTAVLAGDALLPLAFEILSQPETHPAPEVRLALVSALARAAGAEGMVGGQMIDILADKQIQPLDVPEVELLQALKTGALFGFCCDAGALLGEAGAVERKALRRYAAAFGLAFQIVDDLLDFSGNAAKMGKPIGQDTALGKATFVSLLGPAVAAERAKALVGQCLDSLETFGSKADVLRAAAQFVLARRF